MEITDFVKDAPNLKTLFRKMKEQKVVPSLHEIGGKVDLKLVYLQEDYCVIQTVMQSGVVGTSRTLIYPYGSSIGYRLKFPVKDERR